MYIVIILVTCHSIRLVPTIWEIVQTIHLHWAITEERSWPAWVDMVTGVSHLTLTISSSLSFYIYFILYGAKHKVQGIKSIFNLTDITLYLLKEIRCRWQSIFNTEKNSQRVNSIFVKPRPKSQTPKA